MSLRSSSSNAALVNVSEEMLEEEPPSTSMIPEEVVKAIHQLIPSNDVLDDPSFNSVQYINRAFPTEQSLAGIDDVITKLECDVLDIDDQMRTVVWTQTDVERDGRCALSGAKKLISQLVLQTLEINKKAEQSEGVVKEITRDVKLLDCVKRNLTTAITTLDHLQMIVRGVENLRVLTDRHLYGEIVHPLQGVTEVMKQFQNYSDIPQIKKLTDQINGIQNTLFIEIMQDFQKALTGKKAKSFTPTTFLTEACLVVDVLSPKAKRDLLNWFINLQLDEYLVLFNNTEDSAWLDKIDSRYTWFKKHLLLCEAKFGTTFPPHWEVSERITIGFCRITKEELTNIMERRRQEIDVKLLLNAIQRTSNMEHLLALRFTGNTLLEETNPVIQSNKSDVQNGHKNRSVNIIDSVAESHFGDSTETSTGVEVRSSPFHGIIGVCFLPFLYIYIESLDINISELIIKFALESKADLSNESLINSHPVLPSCADLFIFFKKFLVQCSHLSNAYTMLSLARTFQKYLREYAVKVLHNNLPKLGVVGGSSSSSVTNITVDILLASSLIQNLLKEEKVSRFSKSDVARICCILMTAEYCLETTKQLEEKIKDKVDPSLVEKIDFSQQQDVFHSIISKCITLLVQDLELACVPVLDAISKTHWQSLDAVGDQSEYVNIITSNLKESVPFIKDCLLSTNKYFTHFCIRFANSFISKFIQTLFGCKSLSTEGAEQLLLDTHILKTVLLDLPSVGSQVKRKAPTSYTRVVMKGMNRGTMILKLVMAPVDPKISFVKQFLQHLPDSDMHEFHKVLDMKSLSETEKNDLICLYCTMNSSRIETLVMLSNTIPKPDTTTYK